MDPDRAVRAPKLCSSITGYPELEGILSNPSAPASCPSAPSATLNCLQCLGAPKDNQPVPQILVSAQDPRPGTRHGILITPGGIRAQ